MKAASITAERRLEKTKLMTVKGSAREISIQEFSSLNRHLRHEDLLVANISATVPASLWARHVAGREVFEIRLAAFAGEDPSDLSHWWAIALGEGDWRLATEARGPGPRFEIGDELEFAPGFGARVVARDPRHGSLFQIRLSAEDIGPALYRHGRPIQYSYHRRALDLWDVQTPLAQIPLSVEPPSALFPFTWQQLFAIERRSRIVYLLHGAGISSTGDSALDRILPLSEFFSLPRETLHAIEETRNRGGRVIAIGTSAARAVESAFVNVDKPVASGRTSLRLGPSRPMRVVGGLLTGFHDAGTSHYELETSLLRTDAISGAETEGRRHGFRGHEFGDSVLLLKE